MEKIIKAAVDRGALSAAQAAEGSEVVLISFPAVTAGTSTRLRIHETYVDPNRYARVGDELVWDRNLGRAMNRIVLPHGWYLTHSDIPASVGPDPDGRIALTFWNPRPDGIQAQTGSGSPVSESGTTATPSISTSHPGCPSADTNMTETVGGVPRLPPARIQARNPGSSGCPATT